MIATSVGTDRGGRTQMDETMEQTSRLWLAAPRRWRYEVDSEHGLAVHVTDGARWWSYGPGAVAYSNEADPQAQASGEHPEWEWLHPESALEGLRIVRTRRERRSGREVEVLDAQPSEDQWVRVAPGADAYAFVVDRERDAVLRFAALSAGREYLVVETLDLERDAGMPDALFRIELPPGVRFVPPPRPVPPPRRPRWLRRLRP
jgi:outer membrane lipoprotein-sorting protein